MAGARSAHVERVTRKIIVARSCPAIADPLEVFLGAIGFTTHAYERRTTLDVVTGEEIAGAMISTGTTPQVEQSPLEILARLRALRPDLPVALVAWVPFDRLRRSFGLQLGAEIELIEGSSQALRCPNLGDHDVIPVMQFSDIERANGIDIFSAIITRHFR